MAYVKRALLALVLAIPVAIVAHKAFAIHKAYAVYSPQCPENLVVEAAGDALVNINQVELAPNLFSFNVVIDTEKMTYQDLIKALEEKGCYIN